MPTHGAAPENRNYFKKPSWDTPQSKSALLRAKKDQILKKHSFRDLGRVRRFGDTAIAFQCVCGCICLEFTPAPDMTSAAEFQEIIRKISGRRSQSRFGSACCQLRYSKAKECQICKIQFSSSWSCLAAQAHPNSTRMCL